MFNSQLEMNEAVTKEYCQRNLATTYRLFRCGEWSAGSMLQDLEYLERCEQAGHSPNLSALRSTLQYQMGQTTYNRVAHGKLVGGLSPDAQSSRVAAQVLGQNWDLATREVARGVSWWQQFRVWRSSRTVPSRIAVQNMRRATERDIIRFSS